MIMKNIKCLSLLGFLLITASSGLVVPNRIENKEIKKEQPVTYAMNFDGTYEVPLKFHMKMGQDAFSNIGIVEKLEDNYYFTFTQVDPNSLSDMKLVSDGQVGTMIKEEGETKSFTYTVSKEDLEKIFNFTAIVTVMNKLVNFGVELQLDQMNYVSDVVEDRGERPARYIPVIETNARDIEIEKGSLFVLPEATATLKTDKISVNKKVFYLNNGKPEEIEVKDDKFVADKLGTYKVTYTAESDVYKTSLGNNTKAEYSFKITSKVGASVLGKVEDKNNILPKNAQLQTSILTKGETYEKCLNKMKKIADNFQVFELNLFDESGNKINLNGEVTFSIRADDYFNRNEIKVARFVDDKLENLDIENFGRYVKFNSDSDGIFIAYVEGVAFHMPIWGYILIGIACLTVVIGIIVAIIIIKRRKNHPKKIKGTKLEDDEVSNKTKDDTSKSNSDLK